MCSSICGQTHSKKKGQRQLETDKKFSLAIIPTFVLRALTLSSPSFFLSRLPLVSPDSLLCLLSAQVSYTSSEQWPIVFYWAAHVSLPLPLLLPFLYLTWSFFLFCSLFCFSLFSHFWEDWWLKWKKWRKEATKKRVWVNDAGFCLKQWRRERKEIDKFAKVERRWREMLNNGKWRTAGCLLENGGLDIE